MIASRYVRTLFAGTVIASLSLIAQAQTAKAGPDLQPNGKGWGEAARPSEINPAAEPGNQGNGQEKGEAKPTGGARTNGISYHGGPVMLGTTNVYFIWYGNWGSNSANTILTNFVAHEGGSPYYNINTTYYNGSNQHVSNSIAYQRAVSDNYSHGTSLSDTSINQIVSSQISSGALPSDTNAVYFVLTTADVNETSGFCTQYCGWHTHATIGGKDIKYAFVGNPDRCLSACAEQSTSPNNNAGADGMASIVAHELEEATSDPDLNAWYDSRGQENADKCAWTFGTEQTAANGSKYNMVINGLEYLIQRNWVNASGGFCALSY
jgi:hypothetical protein